METETGNTGKQTPRFNMLAICGCITATVALTVAVGMLIISHVSMGSMIKNMAPLEAPIPGFMPGKDKPRFLMAQDIDYPPYA